MSGLFREQVVSRRAAAVLGAVAVPRDRVFASLMVAGLALALGVVAVLAFGTYAPQIPAPGRLMPSTGVVDVTAPGAGVVTALHASEGDHVRTGDPLVLLTSPRSTGDGTDVDSIQIDSLLRERTALDVRARLERELSAAAGSDLRARIDAAHRRAEAAASQYELAHQRVGLLDQDAARLRALARRGHLAATMLDTRLVELIDAREHAQAIEQQRAVAEVEAADLARELERVPALLAVRIAELHSRALAIERELAVVQAAWSRLIRAPVDGTVAMLDSHRGMPVTAGEPLLTLVPAGSHLRAELQVPMRAAAFITPGQRIRLRYDAFPYQRFGLQGATVSLVSASAVIGTATTPHYRVVADLDRQVIPAGGRELPLRPGMTLQADILRERRRIILWLADPLLTVAPVL